MAEASAGGLRPEREKLGLLPPRPDSDELPKPGPASRRPADLWLPRGTEGRGQALDFAVTSAMRGDLFRRMSDTPEAALSAYEKKKREFLDTASLCDAAGFTFEPMIFEAHSGAWSTAARAVFDWMAHQAAVTLRESAHVSCLRLAQRISVTLHRENARAVLRRVPVVDSGVLTSAWALAGPWL